MPFSFASINSQASTPTPSFFSTSKSQSPSLSLSLSLSLFSTSKSQSKRETKLSLSLSLSHTHTPFSAVPKLPSLPSGPPMDKDTDDNNSVIQQTDHFAPLDYHLEHNNPRGHEESPEMVDYMLCNSSPQPQISLDKLNFSDVMQFADFGPKLALNYSKITGDVDDNHYTIEALMAPPPPRTQLQLQPLPPPSTGPMGRRIRSSEYEDGEEDEEEEDGTRMVEAAKFPDCGAQKAEGVVEAKSNKRKRPRSLKTTEEVESQRMTHIAVERNRRRQMNDHLRVLRSLMPGSYVQRGDQASIIGGAIEFVRELEQLLQCLESQKRRRLFGGSEAPPRAMADATNPPYFPALPVPDHSDPMKLLELDPSGLQEEMAENKSCLADVEIRLHEFDVMIKILSQRRPGQLLKIIAALEDLQFNILHTNVTTIEQTVLYSFNVKITGETRYTAENIANSVQQILGFIDANPF